MTVSITNTAALDHTEHHVHVQFDTPHRVISSAVLNGGVIRASHIVNMKVPKACTCAETPQVTLTRYCADSGWDGTSVGMMTAASMDSFRMEKESAQGIEIVALVTAGLSNPRRAGDRAEHRSMAAHPGDPGTINIIVLTSAVLTESASVEALLIVAEAKSAALQEAGVTSPVSNKIATGTGTDSVAVACGHGPQTVGYCGKHVLFGELLGRTVSRAVASSIAWDLKKRAINTSRPGE